MQKTLLLLLFLGIGNLIYGQNWDLFNADTRYYFKKNDADIITNNVFITSATALENSTFFELNKVILPCDTCVELESIVSEIYNCVNSCVWLRDQAQFAGTSLLRNDDESWEIHYGDSAVVILSNASPGAEWDYSTGITANVTGLSSSLFLGDIDSLKTISLSNGGSIVLSKNHGLISIAPNDEDSYTQCGQFTDEALGETPPDWEQLFDIAPGTTLEYQYYKRQGSVFGFDTYASGIKQLRVNSVEVNPEQIDINYSWISRVQDPAPPWGNETDPFILSYGSAQMQIPLEQPGWDSHYPNEEFRTIVDVEGGVDGSSPEISAPPAGLLSLGKVYDRYFWQIGNTSLLGIESLSPLFSTEANPWYPGLDDEISPYNFCYGEYEPDFDGGSFLKGYVYSKMSFVEGLGIGEYQRSEYYLLNGNSQDYYEHWVLTGFAFEGDTTGTMTPDHLLGVEDEKLFHFSLYPNPTRNGAFTISFDKAINGICKVIDSRGAVVSQFDVQAERSVQLDLNERISSGMYFVIATDEERQLVYRQKLIVQH